MGLAEATQISPTKARALILDMARYGDNSHRIPHTASEQDIAAWFEENKYRYSELITRLRSPGARVPLVENLIGPNWNLVASTAGVVAATVQGPGGPSPSISSSGSLSLSACYPSFDAAQKSLGRAIQGNSYQDLLQALASGFASLEAFVAQKASEWNTANASNLLSEPRNRTFEEKVDEWFPIISRGRQYDRSRADWSMLQTLRKIRDKGAIHPSGVGYAVSDIELATIINNYQKGISETLFRFHLFFEMRMPCAIIRARYAPAVFAT